MAKPCPRLRVMGFMWTVLLLSGSLCMLVEAGKEGRPYCIIGAGPAGMSLSTA